MSSPHVCLDDDVLLELARGQCGAERAQALLNEIEHCADCMLLVGEAGRAVAEVEGDDGTEPSPWLQRSAMLPNGMLLAGRFMVAGLLGRGGMGEVYEVLDTELGERVALKTIAPALACEAVNIERFRQEVRLARKVVEPHVCRVLEFGRHEAPRAPPLYFLTMELLRGQLLSQRLRARGPLPLLEVLSIVRQLATGLSAIHDEGVLHRDIKTSNVMLCTATGAMLEPGTAGAAGAEERAVLLDFGVARLLGADSASLVPSGLVGTPDYMAPEQLQGDVLSPATDVYAVGVIFFQLLTGRLPFEAEQAFARALQRLHTEPPSPSSVRPQIPRPVDALVRRCLDPEPLRRLASARELLNAVRELEELFASGVPLDLARAPRTRRQSGSWPKALGLALIALVLTLAFGTLLARTGLFRDHESMRQAPRVVATTTLAPAPPIPSSNEAALRAEVTTTDVEPSKAASAVPSSAPHLPARRTSLKRQSTTALLPPASTAPQRCSPPYYYDAEGYQVFRKECL